MAFLERGAAKIYYEDSGHGEPIVTIHGLSEDANYWSETGITAKLAKNHRVISMDMRGHGRTECPCEPKGYDVETMADDFTALADRCRIDRFHLLSHATGGMVAVRYAMSHSDRLLSLMLTDTGSSTVVAMVDQDGQEVQPARPDLEAYLAKGLPPVDDVIASIHAKPGVFLFKMASHPYSDRLWAIYDGFLRRQSRREVITFLSRFYTDPDPKIDGLRGIKCPTLILLGGFDYVFLKPSELMAKEILNNRHVVMEGVGHMTAIEAPIRTAHEILDFLDCVAKRGDAVSVR